MLFNLTFLLAPLLVTAVPRIPDPRALVDLEAREPIARIPDPRAVAVEAREPGPIKIHTYRALEGREPEPIKIHTYRALEDRSPAPAVPTRPVRVTEQEPIKVQYTVAVADP
jgi:hypothetical protein